MPWCEDCARFYNPNTLTTDGDCPAGHHVESVEEADAERARIPWHFWVMLVALMLYLGWRLIQGILWLFT